jgi:hypothetical protein
VPTTYDATSNEIVGSGLTGFSEFVLAGDQQLPVELASFDARVTGRSVALTWTTLTETNNAGFEVYLAGPEDGFQQVAWVPGAGTTVDPKTYSFTAEGLNPGLHRFRLKQIDFDGAFEYSETVEAFVELPGAFVLEEIYPNPFNPVATVRFAVLAEQPVQLMLYDAAGRHLSVLYEGRPEANRMQEVRLYGTDLPSGTYFVRLEGPGISATQTVTLLK